MRLFVAVDPSEEVRQALAGWLERLRPRAPDAKWSRADAFHLTLAFLGNVADELVEPIGRALEAVAGRHLPVELEAAGGGSFGGRRPRVLWAGLRGPDLERLAALRRGVEEAMVPFGYQPEARPFQPHFTLARAREAHGDPRLAICAGELDGASMGRFVVEELVLYRSELSPKGARYTPLSHHPLGR